MNIQLIRHATLRLTYNGADILVDPMLSDAGANPPIPNSANERRNPLVPLPVPANSLSKPELVLLTHLHRDHWDEAAINLLAAGTPIVCQPNDEAQLKRLGFSETIPVQQEVLWHGIRISRTDGEHGTGEIGQAMGQVSGFVLEAEGEPTLYLAGDTIYCGAVEQALDKHHPDVTVLNAGGARFMTGDPITMTPEDVVRVCRHAPYSKVLPVHMDAINHCLATRDDLRRHLAAAGILGQVTVLLDGESL